ncbi:T9SS type A sorting domain-containing protein [Hymenobacter sp. BT683]|uniref:T9SS type A sorting domain-containing protein n=1 Tax=Hymenobacter jeongseonensis TaxID=2791027 RepID=A0ABS0IJB1_9BACT|nr:T9SS type A sorting domain-containing protein [Hymenobacter jeongseonensis]MBF9238464.1 T9SS type A sorting domain-containing protein [Hymenobacter jeongseonensis]
MQTITFTQKLLRQRFFFNCLIPLLALFVGLGASQTAQAAIGITTNAQAVNINQGSGNARILATAFDGITLVDQKPGSTTTPAFDINTGQLLLNGGEVTTTESTSGVNQDRVTRANVEYRVFLTGEEPGAYQSIALTQVSYVLSQNGTGTRVWSLSTAARNVIKDAIVTAAGNYSLQIRFSASGTRTKTNNGQVSTLGPVYDDNGSAGYTADFDVVGAIPVPTKLFATQVFLDINGVDPKTENTAYDASDVTAAPQFEGFNFGPYDINTGELFLNGGKATTFESGGEQVTAVRLYYRVYKSGSITAPAFTNLALQGGGTATNGTRTFALSTAQQNLITGLLINASGATVAGAYFIETYFEADVSQPDGTVTIISDNDGGTFYRANLSITGQLIETITWTGGIDDDWFTAGNWDANKVPTALTNVIIPDFGPANPTPYPNINSGVSYTTSAGRVKDNTNSGPALARNLVLQGASQAQRSILRVIKGRINIYGDFMNQLDSFIMRDGTTIGFMGVNQQISGGSGFPNVVIAGGGIKNLPGSMLISESFRFDDANGGGIFTTDIAQPTRSFVELTDRSSNNNQQGAQLVGESETSYIRGFVKTNRANILASETDPRTFGNIGLELDFIGNNPGDVLVTRNTAENYTPLGTKFSIRRIFGVRPSNPNTNSGGLNATMTFHYLDNETRNLGPTGNGFIAEDNLTIFVSSNSGGTFRLVGRDGPVNTTANRVTKTGVRTFATFTLGDVQNPLPVRLVAFDAQRFGADALVTWKTATEENSKGYDVQVSTNGKVFRTLASVPSATPNSSGETEYRYVDMEKNKSGVRYYRLRQVDLDGTETFFAPRTVTFSGKISVEPAVAAYPNPFSGNDDVHLALQSDVAGKGQFVLTDMTGRIIRQQAVELTTGITDFSVAGMKDLTAGIYMVRVTLPTGDVKTLKVVKQ